MGFVIDRPPPRPAIFDVIRAAGAVPPGEMHRVFNMGLGFVVAVPQPDAERAVEIAARHGHAAQVVGRVDERAGRVEVRAEQGALVLGRA